MSDAGWPGDEEDRVLDEMGDDQNSPQWDRCDAKVAEIVKYVCRDLPNEDVEEIVNDVCDDLRHSLRTFRRECSIGTWITRIAGNQRNNRLRRIIRDRQTLESLDAPRPDARGHPATELPDPDPYTPERVCITHERMEYVVRLCHRYIEIERRQHPERDYSIVALLLQGYDRGEIAAELGLPPQTVANVLFALRQYLRERLLLDWLGDEWPWV